MSQSGHNSDNAVHSIDLDAATLELLHADSEAACYQMLSLMQADNELDDPVISQDGVSKLAKLLDAKMALKRAIEVVMPELNQ